MAEILEQTLATLNIDDPLSDMTINLDAGDSRFLGSHGHACTAPGARESDLHLLGTHGMNFLAVTSGVVASAMHMQLIRTAADHVRQYDIALAEYLRKANNP